MNTRREFLRIAGAGVAAACLPRTGLPGPADEQRPNIVFLFSDDQRADALGCMGNSVIETPHLDALAADGMLFRNAFVTTSICCVSRVSVLTGQYALRHGIHDFKKVLSDEAMSQTYPELLRARGYDTGFIGKWGIGANNIANIRKAAGYFDYWAGGSYQTNFWHERDCPWVRHDGRDTDHYAVCDCPPDANGRRGPHVRKGHANMKDPVHLTTQIIPEKVESFLDTRDADRPFCLSISFKAAHSPWSDWDPSLAQLYSNDRMPVSETATPEEARRMPEFIRKSLGAPGGAKLARRKDRLQRIVRHYYRLVTTLDSAIGKIRRSLKARGLDDNTVIVFMSDNGHFLAEHGLLGKWLMYEESIRVPTIIFDPRSPDAQRGETCDEMVLNIDVAPTILDFAGAPVPSSMQGKSMLPLLREPKRPFRNDWFYEHRYSAPPVHDIPRTEGVRTRRWKYIRYIDTEPVCEQLFDLHADPQEKHDLAGEPRHKDTLRKLRKRRRQYSTELAG